MVQVNVTALVELTRLLLPAMLARKRGRILNIGSTAGFQPGPFMATYYATKAFVNSFTEALAYELKGTGVTATLSCPGATETEFAGHAGNAESLLFRLGAADSLSVAREAYAAMMAGRSRIVHGFTNRLGVQAVRIGPKAAVLAVTARLNRV
jgi:short-subunit dehydrogenase